MTFVFQQKQVIVQKRQENTYEDLFNQAGVILALWQKLYLTQITNRYNTS